MALLNRIAGHNRQKEIIINALRRGRIATTYLFCGESGIGKKTFAVEFARLLNCEAPLPGPDACDNCSSCRKISTNRHPDILLVSPEANIIKIEMIREVQEFLSMAPYEGKTKVVIIDEAHLMNQAASNAFLKTLEEPAPESLIILVSSLPEQLLETIRSRCFRLNFSPLNEDDTRDVIKTYLNVHGEASLETLLRLSMGRPGLVGSALSEGVLDEFDDFSRVLTHGSVPDRIKDRADMEHWIDRLLIILRDLVLVQTLPDTGKKVLFAANLEDFYSRVSKKFETDFIIKLYTQLNEIKRMLKFNINLAIARNVIESRLKEQYQ